MTPPSAPPTHPVPRRASQGTPRRPLLRPADPWRSALLIAALLIGSGGTGPSAAGASPPEPARPPETAPSATPETGSPSGPWALVVGGRDRDWAHDLAVDRDGATYVVGHFKGTTEVQDAAVHDAAVHDVEGHDAEGRDAEGPAAEGRDSPGRPHRLESAGGTDVLVAKISAHGRVEWLRRLGGPLAEEARGVAVDDRGGVYVTGYFADRLVPTGVGSLPGDEILGRVASAGSSDIFLVKLDAATGALGWLRHWGGPYGDVGFKVATGPSTPHLDTESLGTTAEGVWLTGYFQERLTFPGPVPGGLTPPVEGPMEGLPSLDSAGLDDAFLMHLDGRDGRVLWAQAFGSDGLDHGKDVAVAPDGTAFVALQLEGTADLSGRLPGHPPLVARGSDVALWRVAPDGTTTGAWSWGGEGPDSVEALALDGAGGAYLAGAFFRSFEMATPPPPQTNPETEAGARHPLRIESDGATDAFLARVDAAGRPLWLQALGGPVSDLIFGLAPRPDGDGVVTAGFSQLPPREAQASAEAVPLVVAVTPEGDEVGHLSGRGTRTLQPLAVATAPAGSTVGTEAPWTEDLWILGSFQGDVTWNLPGAPGEPPVALELPSAGRHDVFLIRVPPSAWKGEAPLPPPEPEPTPGSEEAAEGHRHR